MRTTYAVQETTLNARPSRKEALLGTGIPYHDMTNLESYLNSALLHESDILNVMPAKAGIQLHCHASEGWTPAPLSCQRRLDPSSIVMPAKAGIQSE